MEQEKFLLAPLPKNKTGRIYCGPTVLTLLTGMEYPKLRATINRLRNSKMKGCKNPHYRKLNRPVKGMFNYETEILLKKFGLKPDFTSVEKNPYKTLRHMADATKHLKTPFVVNVTRHYMILLEGVAYDTAKPEGVPAEDHPYSLKRVACFWRIRSKSKVQPVS